MANLYYRISDPSDVRAIESQIIAWQENNNPKAELWALQPEKPSEDAFWSNGTWVTPPALSYTANEWLEKEGFNPVVLVTLLDLETKLDVANKVSNKLVAVRGWINSILAQYIENSFPKSDWLSAPYSVEETISQAFQVLNT